MCRRCLRKPGSGQRLTNNITPDPTEHSLAIALVSNCSDKRSILVKAISATGAQLLFDTGSAGAIASDCPVHDPQFCSSTQENQRRAVGKGSTPPKDGPQMYDSSRVVLYTGRF